MYLSILAILVFFYEIVFCVALGVIGELTVLSIQEIQLGVEQRRLEGYIEPHKTEGFLMLHVFVSLS